MTFVAGSPEITLCTVEFTQRTEYHEGLGATRLKELGLDVLPEWVEIVKAYGG